MIIIIVKELRNGRWYEVDGNTLYTVGEIIRFKEGTYRVVQINRSKVTLERVN